MACARAWRSSTRRTTRRRRASRRPAPSARGAARVAARQLLDAAVEQLGVACDKLYLFALWICLARPPCPACQLAQLARCIPTVCRACAERVPSVPALNVSQLLRADGQEFAARTQDTRRILPRQTRRHRRRRIPFADRAHADRHADAQSKDTQTDTQTRCSSALLEAVPPAACSVMFVRFFLF